jgi:hypothetical protein
MSERPAPRSAGTLQSRRSRLPWPADREFRILSIDGGGIRGIFPAAVLAGIAGTSTGGILALGLGAELTAAALLKLYVERGCEIFPPLGAGLIGRLRRHWRARRQIEICGDAVAAEEALLVSATSTIKMRSSAC